MYKILAIDGGGIRGLIPAIVLSEIERRTGKPTAELFDLMAGTSAGGLVAMGLNVPDEQGQPAWSAEQIALIYEQEGGSIFSRSVWHAVQTVGSWSGSKYPADSLEDVLERCFGEYMLAETVRDVLITSYEIHRRQPWFFRSSLARMNSRCNFKMRDVVRATSAAPTFFEPAQIFHPEADTDFFALIDGGMQANNPALCAYVEAQGQNPDEDDFLLVSLGAGVHANPLPYEEARQWGLAGWAQHVFDIVVDAASSTVDFQLRRLVPRGNNGQQRYYRFQIRLVGVNDDIDDASPQNISAIKSLASQLIDENDDLLDQLVEQLLLE